MLRAGPSRAKPILDAQLAARVASVVREERIDVVHAHNIEAPFATLPARLLMGVPVVQHVHMLAEEELPTFVTVGRRPARWAGRWIDRAVPRLVDALVVLSERAGDQLRSHGVPSHRIHLIPPAVHPDDFGPAAARRPGPPCVVYAGNPDAYQEPETLLKAFAAVIRERPEVTLRLVSGASMAPWAAAARRLGIPAASVQIVRVSTWREVQAAHADATLGVVPRSVCAGFPIKLLNYMAMGLPVVACRGAAGPLRTGEEGLVVDDGDSRAFARAMLRLLGDEDLRHRMGSAARASVLREHTWAHRAQAFDAVHQTVLADREDRA
jgi:glycosyltransferase involved in cell wall biosynthesis